MMITMPDTLKSVPAHRDTTVAKVIVHAGCMHFHCCARPLPYADAAA